MPPKVKNIKEAIDMALGITQNVYDNDTWKSLFEKYYSKYLKNHPKSEKIEYDEDDEERVDESDQSQKDTWISNFKMISIYERKIMEAITLLIPELKKQDTLTEFRDKYANANVDWSQITSQNEDIIYEFRKQLNWDVVSKRAFDEKFIPHIADYLKWDIVSRSNISDRIIRKYADRLDWKYLSERGLSESLLREFSDKIKWKHLPLINFTESFILEYYNRLSHIVYTPPNDKMIEDIKAKHIDINWATIKTDNLTDEFIINNSDKINWVLNRNDLSKRKWEEEFIAVNADKFSWKDLPVSHLSAKFLYKYRDQINWGDLSCEIRSEKFIRTFHKNVVWENLPAKNYSDDFAIEFKSQIYWPKVEIGHFKEETIEACCDNPMFPWNRVSRMDNLSEAFMKKHRDSLDWEIIAKKNNLSKTFRKEFASKLDKYKRDDMKTINDVEETYTINLGDITNQKFMSSYK